jgi:hypothetical protein
LTTAARPDFRLITSTEDLATDALPAGAVVQEIHTGNCCDAHEFMCDLFPPQWEKAAGRGWTRSGQEYNADHDEPRLPVQLLWHPDWVR